MSESIVINSAKDRAQSVCQIKNFVLGIDEEVTTIFFSKFEVKISTKHVKTHLEVSYDMYSLLNQ